MRSLLEDLHLTLVSLVKQRGKLMNTFCIAFLIFMGLVFNIGADSNSSASTLGCDDGEISSINTQ